MITKINIILRIIIDAISPIAKISLIDDDGQEY